jgi:hypothetical protein
LNDRLVWLGASQRYPRQSRRNLICDLWTELEELFFAGHEHGGIYSERA